MHDVYTVDSAERGDQRAKKKNFFFFWPLPATCGISVPRPEGLNPGSQQWKHWVLTPGPPGNFQEFFCLNFSCLAIKYDFYFTKNHWIFFFTAAPYGTPRHLAAKLQCRTDLSTLSECRFRSLMELCTLAPSVILPITSPCWILPPYWIALYLCSVQGAFPRHSLVSLCFALF